MRRVFVDARNLPADETLTAEVCVLGAGAAGISLALALGESNMRVMLVESGGFEPRDDTQSLYAGETEGDDYLPLDSVRLRYLGGTTNHWSGNCRPLDAVDFTARSWIPNSGWPIGLSEIQPYYDARREAL